MTSASVKLYKKYRPLLVDCFIINYGGSTATKSPTMCSLISKVMIEENENNSAVGAGERKVG